MKSLETALAELERLAEKATKGEWSVFVPKRTGGALGDSGDRGIDASGVMIGEMWEHGQARNNPDGYRLDAISNAAYVCATQPQAITDLIALVRAQRDEVRNAALEEAAVVAENAVAIRTMGLTTRDHPGDRKHIPQSQSSITIAQAIRALKSKPEGKL
ncbi:hypothetical protein UFOVP1169_37 [uncultured Caudovirales phage]|uniref:Ead/Ea22-like family protein n=1 Tax=uncultured Caudovirales phage TaxID=2100421 RepID=A0A6J5QTR1_9CAUD|nr:hypothetical protein UFOVP1169_37 [uncultured Caudovirales phage]